MMNKKLFVQVMIAMVFAIIPSYTQAKTIPKKIMEREAQHLAALGLDFHTKEDISSLDFEDDDPNPPFFEYYGIGNGDGSYGYFAVNPWTGDVWALWGCRTLSTPALRKAQAEIRHRFTAAEKKQYRKLRSLKPECISGD